MSVNADVAPTPADPAPTSRRAARTFKVPDLNPGLVTRIKYASYLFVGLFACLLLRGAIGKAMSDIPYLQRGCQLVNPADATTAPAPPSIFHGGTVPSGGGLLPPEASQAVGEAAQLLQFTKKLITVCYENVTVYRISFGLAIFYFIHLISVSDFLCCVDDDARAELQTTFFSGKTVLVVLLNIAVFWIPNDFYVVYAYICVFVSAIFLLIQIALIVDFSYIWNEEWGSRSEENPKWMWYLGFMTLLMYGVGIYLTVFNYMNFVPHQDCNLHGFIVTGCLLFGVLYTAVAIWVPHGSVLPSGMIFAYTSFLATSALRMSTDKRCNLAFVPAGSETFGMMLSYAVIAAGTLAYSVISMSGKYSAWTQSGNGEEEAPEEEDEGTGHSHQHTSRVGHLPAYCYFHGVMLMGSMYLAMLGTDWQVSGGFTSSTKPSDIVADGGATTPLSFWVKLATQWLTIAVYMWSLLAPYTCCKHRDFGYDTAGFWDNS